MKQKQITQEIIVRGFGAGTAEIKEALAAVNAIENVSCQLFGKDNEFIIKVSAVCGGEAAAKSLCESAAQIIENTLGDDAYGRGAKTLAHKAASALIANEAQLCAACKELGEMLEQEFNTTKHGANIYDYGDATYNSKNAGKIKISDATLKEYGVNSIEATCELALSARKLAKVRFGAALSQADAEGHRWIVVAEKSQTYVRQLPPNESMRGAALAVLDLVRRISLNVQVLQPSRETETTVRRVNHAAHKLAIGVACVSLAVSIAVGAAAYFCYDKYYIPNQPSEEIVQAFK